VNPTVSIVIPIFNGVKYTIDCVNSIYDNAPDFPFEVIVVGTGTDGSVGLFQDWELNRPNFRFVHNTSEHKHFAANINLGASHALGDYICILNNDIIVTPKWLDQLVSNFKKILGGFSGSRPCPPPAAIGPCSNYVMQHQMVQLPKDFRLEDINRFSAEVNHRHRGQWFYASIISGFCMLFDRLVFNMLGGFDAETFINGNEDVDFCIRLNEAGFSCIVDRSTFIFHHGSKTLTAGYSEVANTESGTMNRLSLIWKHFGREPKEQKISGNVRLRCSKEELEAWLTRHYELFEVVNIVDDDSGWDMGSYLKTNWPKCVYVNATGKIEVQQRQMLYLLSVEQKMDWMVVLDHDEFLEEKVDRAYLQHIADQPLPGCHAYVARWIHLWNSPHTYHVKYPPSLGLLMRRVYPNLAFQPGAPETSFHCSRIPEVPVVGSSPTNIHVLHYGYMDPQKREQKRQWYEAMDPNPVPQLVGGSNYAHLTSQTEISISEWRGSFDYTIALTAMTEHEPLHQVQMLLEQVGSMMDEMQFRTPPNSPAIPLLKRWGANVTEKEWNNDFSNLRNLLIDKAKSAYILVMDIDEQLQDPLEIVRLLELQPTAILYTIQNLQPGKRPPANTEVMRIFQNRPDIRFGGLIHETVEDALNSLRHKNVVRASGDIIHMGFLTKRLPDKLKAYVKMNKTAIYKDPQDPKPYFNLALHFIEEGDMENALSHLQTAIVLQPKFTLAKLELGKLHARFAHAIFASALDDFPEQHPLKGPTAQYERILANVIPPTEPEIFPPLKSLAPASRPQMEGRKQKK
jgi:GT2 family glycosyltransferase